MKSKLLLLVALFFTAFSINAQINSVAIVGARVGGWPPDPQPVGYTDPNQFTRVTPGGDDWTIDVTVLATGGLKFRANNSWTAGPTGGNWGVPASGSQYPSNTCVNDGGSGDFTNSIPAGTYTILFNSATGVYNFTGGPILPNVKITGTAVLPDTEIGMNNTSLSTFELKNKVLAAGTLQFRIDGAVAGGTSFPGTTGAANEPTTPLTSAADFINVVAGKYDIQLDSNNGTYSFVLIPEVVNYKMTIVGGATPISWPPYAGATTAEQNMVEDTQKMINNSGDNENYYFPELPLTAGAGLKFRVNNDWTGAFGGGSFPTGPTPPGDNIDVTTAGTYSVEFVRSTGAYNFFTPKVGLLGAGIAGWGDAEEINMNTTDGITYTLNGVVAAGGPCKFRLDKRWFFKSWGSSSFPSGTGLTAGGSDIPATAGTYNVTFNRLTGAYAFTTASVSTVSFQAAGFKVAPNPTATSWNFSSSKEAIVSIQVIDMLGKTVINTNNTDVDASALTNGVYFAKVSSANATETVKLVKN